LTKKEVYMSRHSADKNQLSQAGCGRTNATRGGKSIISLLAIKPNCNMFEINQVFRIKVLNSATLTANTCDYPVWWTTCTHAICTKS